MKASLDPFRFSLATPSGIGPWMIAMLTVNGLVGIMAQPHMLATVGTGRDERTCRVGMLFGNMSSAYARSGGRSSGCGRGDGRARTRRCRVAGGSGERLRLRVPAAPVPRRPRADDRLDSRGEHVNLFGVSGGQRRAVHRGTVSARASSGPAATVTICGWVASAGSSSRWWACSMRSSSIKSVLYTFLLTETLATFVGIGLLGRNRLAAARTGGARWRACCRARRRTFCCYYLTGQRLDHWDPNVFLAALAAGVAALVGRQPAHAARAGLHRVVIFRPAPPFERQRGAGRASMICWHPAAYRQREPMIARRGLQRRAQAPCRLKRGQDRIRRCCW